MIRYRIGIINEYAGITAFIDYRDYGGLEIWDASWVRSVDTRLPKIHVFLNFTKQLETNSKAQAREVVEGLLRRAPVNLDEFRHVLNEAI